MRILGLTTRQLEELFRQQYGKGAYHAQAAYTQIMQRGQLLVRDLPEFLPAPALARRFEQDLNLDLPQIVCKQETAGTIKFLSRLGDGQEIESVIIPMHSYATVCVSSQVGCRMACAFCSTGKSGLTRNLEASEIVGQVYLARFGLRQPVRNIVFMGMGEPLDNLDQVVQAIRVLSDQKGMNIPLSKITLSTAGKVDGLRQLGAYQLNPLRIAISLNACEDSLRSRLMPVNHRYPLAELKKCLREYPLRSREIFFIEYILLRGVNDSQVHARQLADFVRDLPVRVNLIPYNPGSDSPDCVPDYVPDFVPDYVLFKRPSDKEVQAFADLLRQQQIFVRIRWSKGSEIAAGCGQLRTKKSRSGTSFIPRNSRVETGRQIQER